MSKRLKKKLNIMLDEKEGHLYFGDKKKDLKLLMIRPLELIEFSEFAGTNADDILIWVGKSLGKEFMEKFFYHKDWTNETMATRKEVLLGSLEALELMGYGHITCKFRKNHILLEVEDSLACEESDNIMAKNLCILYQGIFGGLFEILKMDVDGEEIACALLEAEKCTYKFDFIGGEFEDSLIDEESEQNVSEFLSTL